MDVSTSDGFVMAQPNTDSPYPHHYSADAFNEGDVVAYVGAQSRGGSFSPPDDRDWLRVTRIDEHGIHGFRTNPQDWEREIEFTIVHRQIEANGVFLDV